MLPHFQHCPTTCKVIRRLANVASLSDHVWRIAVPNGFRLEAETDFRDLKEVFLRTLSLSMFVVELAGTSFCRCKGLSFLYINILKYMRDGQNSLFFFNKKMDVIGFELDLIVLRCFEFVAYL